MFSSGISARDSVSEFTRLVDAFKLLIPGLGLSTPSGFLVCNLGFMPYRLPTLMLFDGFGIAIESSL